MHAILLYFYKTLVALIWGIQGTEKGQCTDLKHKFEFKLDWEKTCAKKKQSIHLTSSCLTVLLFLKYMFKNNF